VNGPLQDRAAAPATVHAADLAFAPQPGAVDHGDDAAYCFPALDEAGQYERAGAWRGRTAWDAARAFAPAAIFLPDHWRDAILRAVGRPEASGFPPGWDADMITSAVLAVARDPDRITWDDPAAWPGTEMTGQPCWRAEGAAGAVTITVALSTDGEIIGARPGERPGAAGNLRSPPAVTGRPGDETRQREGARA